MDLSWSVEREGDLRFVACRVHNAAAVPRRVRVRSRSDGPVLPPRRAGVPEEGWDATGVTLRLEPNERRGVGFAVVVPVDERIADPPVEVADVDPIDDCDPPAVTADTAVRSLDDHRPPRAALVDPERAEPSASVGADPETRVPNALAEAEGVDERVEDEFADDRAALPSEDDGGPPIDDDGGPPIDDDGGPPIDDDTDPPTEVPHLPSVRSGGLDERLDRVERRVERAERLTGADLGTATEAVDGLGGVAAVATLAERVANDAAALRRLSERASSLAARAEATDVPTDALERLA
ncbi:hypothetical protein DQW50_01570 [Halorubrum sp. 48-1-W]|nr:hypothetical protein DQW50_01570 [Halorubrum sp. 48-1-W]